MQEKQLETMFSSIGAGASLDKDEIAEMLKVSPEALDAFEDAYHVQVLSQERPDDLFQINSRQAAEQNRLGTSVEDNVDTSELQKRIVDELLARTASYFYDGSSAHTESFQALPAGARPVTLTEINRLPEAVRPQVSGELMKRDSPENSAEVILAMFKLSKTSPDPKIRKFAYDHFRQGLDILDLDWLTYEIIGTNPNSMGYWLPPLVRACQGQNFFKIPKTAIVRVPITLLQLTRTEYSELTPTTIAILDSWAHKAFHLNDEKEYFIKTGTYSSKFDFRNAHVKGEKEVRELGEYLLYIHYQALQMASPLVTPTIYGVSTTNEWVVREWIPDKENNPCVYKGMPLHTEYRIFIDCDTKEIIGYTPYWEPNTMMKRFGGGQDADSPHQMHDYVIYKAHEETLMGRYYANIYTVVEKVRVLLPDLALHGQWSLDIMQNGDDFWLIDMALAENSAFYRECVPPECRRPTPENWLPELLLRGNPPLLMS